MCTWLLTLQFLFGVISIRDVEDNYFDEDLFGGLEKQGSVGRTAQQQDCSTFLFMASLFSILFPALAFCLGVSVTGKIVIVYNFLLLVPAMYQKLVTAVLFGDNVHPSCTMFVGCEIVTLVVWTFFVVVERFELHHVFVALCFPSVSKILRKRWEAIQCHISGPAKAFYESAQYKELCEIAINEADNDRDGILTVHDFHLAVCNVVHDVDWLRGGWLRTTFLAHRSTPIPSDECLEVLQQTAAVIMETQGCGLPILYDLRMLQLSSTHNAVCIEEIEAAFQRHHEKWDPSKRKDVSKYEAVTDYARLRMSYQNAVEYVKTRGKSGIPAQ